MGQLHPHHVVDIAHVAVAGSHRVETVRDGLARLEMTTALMVDLDNQVMVGEKTAAQWGLGGCQ